MTLAEPRPVSLAEVGRSTLVLTGGAFLVQVIGFARQLFLAAEIGVTSELDALLIALAAPMALVGILTAGVQVAIVPAYAGAKDERGANAARRLVGTVLVWMAIAGVVASLTLWLFAGPIVEITGPGLEKAGTATDAVGYLRSLAPLGLLLAVSPVFYALCQAESLFPSIAVAQVVGPLLTLAITVAFWDTLALDGLVIGTLLGAIISLAVIVLATVIHRIAPILGLVPREPGLRSLVGHAAPLTASSAILQVNLIFDRAVASWLAAGGVSLLRYGESLVRLPFAAISPAWGQAVYPALVRAHRGSGQARLAEGQAGLAEMTERVVRYALVFFVPLAGLTLAVAPVAVATAYDRGSFTQSDLMLTAQVVAVSAPLIVLWTVAPTLVAALNARRMGTVMMAASILNVALQIVLVLLLGYMLGVIGVAMATTLSTLVVVVLFVHRLARAEPAFSPRLLGRTLARASLAILPSALIFGIPIWAGVVEGDLFVRVVVLVVVGVSGLASYYALAQRLGLEEAGQLVGFGNDSLRRILARVGLGS